MNSKSFFNCLIMVLSSIALGCVAEHANGNATGYAKVQLQEQLARADYAAHVVILQTESLGHVDNGPLQSCGTKYRVRVIEHFKGKRQGEVTSFFTNRFLLPHRRLQAGDHVLALLVDVSNASGTRPEVNQMLEGSTDACRRARGDLYLTDFAENIFTIAFEQGAKEKAWFEFSSQRTIFPAEIGSPELAACEPVAGGGCIQSRPDRIEWERVRKALIAAKERNR
jgi:hypothetical protein